MLIRAGDKSLIALMILIYATIAVAHNPSISDCMRNPFASGCRGISAKRSPVPPLSSWLTNLQSQPRADQPANEPIELMQLQLTMPMALANFESPIVYPSARSLNNQQFEILSQATDRQSQQRTQRRIGNERWHRDE